MSPATQQANFGPCIVETDVDDAVVTCLRKWLPTYLGQIERERTLSTGLLARPATESYANTLDDDEFLDHRLPAVIVTTASTSEAPDTMANGTYSAAWNVVVSTIVRGRTPTETRLVAALFGGSVRRVLLHQPLEAFTSYEVRWILSNVAPVTDTTPAGRYLAAAINEFTIYVDNVVQLGVGPSVPAVPSDDPFDPLAVVHHVTSVVTAKVGS